MIRTLAKMLGLSTEHTEASMHSERAARAVLTRRNLFAAGAALAAGSAFSFAPAGPTGFCVAGYDAGFTQFSAIWICGVRLPGVVGISVRRVST